MQVSGQAPTDKQEQFVRALTSTYAAFLKRQRTASAAFVRWTSPGKRSHEFSWIFGTERLLSGKELKLSTSDEAYAALAKMHTTISLNPYERELLYGYPYVVGFADGKALRGPLFTIPVHIELQSASLLVIPDDERLKFNSLPFRDDESEARNHLLQEFVTRVPELPLSTQFLKEFCMELTKRLAINLNAELDGRLLVPRQPTFQQTLAVVDSAACFIAPKTSYFLVSDLENIGETHAKRVADTSFGGLIQEQRSKATSDDFEDNKRVYFPFSSNRSQRRAATLMNAPNTQIVVIQGPPGTGKSLTIANLVCHLIASGKKVLVSSQKDKALHVVSEMLNSLSFAQFPMTLLKQDRDSQRELRNRLEQVQKNKSAQQSGIEKQQKEHMQSRLAQGHQLAEEALSEALSAEHLVAKAERLCSEQAGMIERLRRRCKAVIARIKASRRAPESSATLGDKLKTYRKDLRDGALKYLGVSLEHNVGTASRDERNRLREFSKLLSRSQTNVKNFRAFDQMKSEVERCKMLLNVLPCWIMTPDDVARLFPCEPNLFDVAIIDEASQCDLPSMMPVLFRSRQLVVAGDSKQMQAQRFAFTSAHVASEASAEARLSNLDPQGWFEPTKIDLLQLASIRMDEEVFLDEHYRCLPQIINFSNERWYGNRLRIMRDHDDRRLGEPGQPVITLHKVDNAEASAESQENHREAEALLAKLRQIIDHPTYSEASIGVLALYEGQTNLLRETIAELFSVEEREKHQIVVVNPDGFQGDERDVILYSLSYDAKGMTQAALSARQAEREHIQGMLNVAFTRARDEIHVFHSAEVESFATATGSGTLRDWLQYCVAQMSVATQTDPSDLGLSACDSEFEKEVIVALRAKGIRTIAQFPSCGFFIDIVAEKDGSRIAIECDGEMWHLDEHGCVKQEDIWRQEILERAGWDVLRIPYREWTRNQTEQIARVERALDGGFEAKPAREAVPKIDFPPDCDRYEKAVLSALQSGERELEGVLKSARKHLGHSRLGPHIRASLTRSISTLASKGLIVTEDSEYFLGANLKTRS